MATTMDDGFFIWDGVYKDFDEAGGSSDAFGQAIWLERSRQRALGLRALARSHAVPSATKAPSQYCFPIVAAVAQIASPRLRLLDFGGCVGFSFDSVVDAVGRPDDVEYHVVDNAGVCRVGTEVFHDEPRISFHSEVPEGRFDVVHLGSSIQYVRDWAAKINELVRSGPRYLVFDDVPAGAIPTFVSLQKYYGSAIPHWFFDAEEFVARVTRETGYELFYRARYVGTFLGERGPLPMGNFARDHRIECALNLAFVAPGGGRGHSR